MDKYIKVKKLNMSQIFAEDGVVKAVTWVETTKDTPSLEKGVVVTIISHSKGKGFAGGMKRHGFHGGPATHGQSDRARAPGSIGAVAMSKVVKGRKMAGRHGGLKVTLKNRSILEVDGSKIAIKGPIPGSYGAKVLLQISSEKLSTTENAN